MSSHWYLKQSKLQLFVWQADLFNDQEISQICTTEQTLVDASVSKIKNGNTPDSSYSDKTTRSTKISFLLPSDSNWDWLYRKVTDCVDHVNHQCFGFDLDKIEPMQYSVYNQGDFFNDHIDMFVGCPEGTMRKLSFVVFLSDPSEYDGGQLIIKTGGDTVVPNEKGTMVFFPSYSLHQVTPVTRGIRKTLVGWVNGPSFK